MVEGTPQTETRPERRTDIWFIGDGHNTFVTVEDEFHEVVARVAEIERKAGRA